MKLRQIQCYLLGGRMKHNMSIFLATVHDLGYTQMPKLKIKLINNFIYTYICKTECQSEENGSEPTPAFSDLKEKHGRQKKDA